MEEELRGKRKKTENRERGKSTIFSYEERVSLRLALPLVTFITGGVIPW